MAKDEILTVKDAIHRLQLSLLEGAKNENQLSAAGTLMSKSDYQDVVTERAIAKLCGYPLCSNCLTSERPLKGRYRISLKEHKVYDVQETYLFCSTGCFINSQAFSAGLQGKRSSNLNPLNLNELLRQFEGFGANTTVNSGENEDLGLSELKIKEKVNIESGEVSSDEWIGPSDAIDGYVPRRDRNLKTQLSKKESRRTDALWDVAGILSSDMSFTRVIIDQDEYSISKTTQAVPSGKPKEKVILKDVPHGNQKQKPDASVEDIMESRHRRSIKQNGLPKINAKLHISEDNACTSQNVSSGNKDESAPSVASLKSSLKTSYSKQTTRTVSWADEKAEGGQRLINFHEMNDALAGVTSHSSEEIGKGAYAESHTSALIKAPKDASEESDNAEVNFPVHGFNEGKYLESNDEIFTEEILKWPPKPGFSNADLVESDDTLHDLPPDGFKLSLSPFCTLFNSLFSWISSSSLAYIYGKEENFHEEYVNVKGREYPSKVVIEDGRSSEIKQTLAGALARALPGVVSELKLPTPISVLEQGMGRLLDTMSFLHPLPSLRMKQWQVIALLFLGALSISRIPALTKYLMGKRDLVHKVLDGAQISGEEYEMMKDLIIPLGRVPRPSTQIGGAS